MLFLFYLLLLFVPTQLGRHFFFDFVQISDIRSDYLTPTIFFTDIIIVLMVAIWIVKKVKSQKSPAPVGAGRVKVKSIQLGTAHFILLSVVCYLLFSSLFVATNIWAALYKLMKIAEFIFLGFIIYQIRPKISTVIAILSIDVFYVSLIAIGQFILQKSVGGILWWLGERTFYASTPGIATFSLGGRLALRPYSTFPHPNVLGGFLAVGVPILFFTLLFTRDNGVYFRKRRGGLIYSWIFISFLAGLTTLFLSMSRAAFIVGSFGFVLAGLGGKLLVDWLKKNSNFSLVIFYTLFFASVAVPLALSKNFLVGQSWSERAKLIDATIIMIKKSPLFGVGLNNAVIHLKPFVVNASGLFVFQPVHNIYLLTASETGLFGYFILLMLLTAIYRQGLKSSPVVVLALTQLYLLGFFDHYLFTLQQGQLLFTLFTSLALCYAA